MRIKSFLIGLCGVVITSALLILFSAAGQQNENLKNIVSQTHQQIREFQVILLFKSVQFIEHIIFEIRYYRRHSISNLGLSGIYFECIVSCAKSFTPSNCLQLNLPYQLSMRYSYRDCYKQT